MKTDLHSGTVIFLCVPVQEGRTKWRDVGGDRVEPSHGASTRDGTGPT